MPKGDPSLGTVLGPEGAVMIAQTTKIIYNTNPITPVAISYSFQCSIRLTIVPRTRKTKTPKTVQFDLNPNRGLISLTSMLKMTTKGGMKLIQMTIP